MRDIWFCLAQIRVLVNSIFWLLLVAVIIVLTYATNGQTLLMIASSDNKIIILIKWIYDYDYRNDMRSFG